MRGLIYEFYILQFVFVCVYIYEWVYVKVYIMYYIYRVYILRIIVNIKCYSVSNFVSK